MTSVITLRFGPATVQVRVDEAYSCVLNSLAKWFEHSSNEEVETPDVSVVLSPGRAPHRQARTRVCSSAHGDGWWDGKAWDAIPSRNEALGTLEWRLFLHESPVLLATRLVPDAVIRWAHAHRFGRSEMLASAALYGHLLPAAQEALRGYNATLVHASAVTSARGDAVLMLGRGGAGKTSASTQLYIRKSDRWRYMSDDLAVVSADGTLYRSPVPLNIFPYNTERFPELWGLLAADMSRSDRLQWQVRRALLGASATARRRSPFRQYIGPPIARIRQVVELDRADIPSPTVEEADPLRVAEEARNVLAHELRRGFDGISRMRTAAGPESPPLTDPLAALDDAERVMRQAFGSARLHRICLSRMARPDAVSAIVERTIE